MVRVELGEVGQGVRVCVASWLALAGSAAAEDADAADSLSSGLGLGGAYLFGLLAGLAIFAVRYAVAQRKAHLAEYGKD
jgi:hypothetical protein